MARIESGELVRRVHSQWARPRGFEELSLRLTADGRTAFFPLDVPDQARAARRAASIRRVVATRGWEAANSQFAREFTLALAWTENPMVFTYATLYTKPDGRGRASTHLAARSVRAGSRSVAFVEGDRRMGSALADWAARLPGYRCAAVFGSAGEVLSCLRRKPRAFDLIFFNRHLPDRSPGRLRIELGAVASEALPVTYHTYDTSDELFFSQPGASEGYYFRRRSPDQLLEPIQSIWQGGRPEPESLTAATRRYVSGILLPRASGDSGQASAELTLRERDILGCLGVGLADKEIASRLAISASTVHTHLKRIYQKMRVRSRTEAVIKYSQM